MSSSLGVEISLAWIVAVVLLVEDAERDGDEMAVLRARRWIARKSTNDEVIAWEEMVALNRKLVFGLDSLSGSAKLRKHSPTMSGKNFVPGMSYLSRAHKACVHPA